jgi:hypothetical protein
MRTCGRDEVALAERAAERTWDAFERPMRISKATGGGRTAQERRASGVSARTGGPAAADRSGGIMAVAV